MLHVSCCTFVLLLHQHQVVMRDGVSKTFSRASGQICKDNLGDPPSQLVMLLPHGRMRSATKHQ